METPQKPNRRKLLGILCVVAVLLIIFTLFSNLSIGPRVLTAARKAKLTNELTQVQTAVLSCYTEYAEYPVAFDNATLIKTLSGESAEGNRRRIAFIAIKSSDLDAKGELLDPWGTPIELSITSDGKLHARSAGPDKSFGTPDDISADVNLSGEK